MCVSIIWGFQITVYVAWGALFRRVPRPRPDSSLRQRRGCKHQSRRVYPGIMKLALAALFLLWSLVQAQEPKALALKTRIDLPNVNGRIDHLTADIKGQRLFMAALGNHTVEVIDVRKGKRVRAIAGLAEPQGVYFDASTNRLFVACGKDGTTKLFDAATFQLLATVHLSGDADNIRYDARARRIIVGYGDGALALLDSNGKKTGEISLDAHPESFQLETTRHRVFVNVPDAKEIEVADLGKAAVISKWPVTSALKNYPMALGESHRRLLIGCRSPARMLVIDTGSGKQIASVEIAGDTDDIFYDAAASRVYVIGGQGFVDVFKQEADRYTRIGHYPTAEGARTGLFVPEWRTLFVAVPHRDNQRSEILVYETK